MLRYRESLAAGGQLAARRAEQIVTQARNEAENIRADADDYAMNSLTQLQDELDRISNQVANGIRLLKDELARWQTTKPLPLLTAFRRFSLPASEAVGVVALYMWK